MPTASGPERLGQPNLVIIIRLHQLHLQQDWLLVLHPLRAPGHLHPQPGQHRGGGRRPSQPPLTTLLLHRLQPDQEDRGKLRPRDLHELREQGGQVPGGASGPGRVRGHEWELQAEAGRQEALLLRPHPPQLHPVGAAGAEEADHLAQDQ